MQIISKAISDGVTQALSEGKPPRELEFAQARRSENHMPFKSKKQEKTMKAAAHNKEFAKKVGIKQSAAKKFVQHSKGSKKGK